MSTISMFYGIWIEIHREELLANWKLCQNGEEVDDFEPLK